MSDDGLFGSRRARAGAASHRRSNLGRSHRGGRRPWKPVGELLEARTLLASLLVTNVADNGTGSLRAEIALANADGGVNTIGFAGNVTGTIALTSGELVVTDHLLTIQGPGSGALTLSGNNASRIFHIEGSGGMTLSDVTLSNGKAATGDGGAILLDSADYVAHEGVGLQRVIMTGNSAPGGLGGAIALDTGAGPAAGVSITDSYLYNNSALTGGVVEQATGIVTINRSTFYFNRADASGAGGALDVGNGTTQVFDSTFTQNSAGSGGALSSTTSSSANVTFVSDTVANNSANLGGGVYNFAGGTPFQLTNTILANNNLNGNQQAPDADGAINSTGHNLFSSTAGMTKTGLGTGDLVATNAGLGALSYYGGPTPTLAPSWQSPALNAGVATTLTTDQRGIARGQAANPTIGAFEGAGTLITNAGDLGGTNPAPGSGTGTLRGAIADANAANNAGLMTIASSMPVGSTITTQAALPTLNIRTLLDATAKPGLGGTIPVQVVGGYAGATGDTGLSLGAGASGSTVRGLSIGGFGTGLSVAASHVTIAGNAFGVGPASGTANATGLQITGSATGVMVGGPNAADTNYVGGNTQAGIVIGAGATANTIENNIIGDPDAGTNRANLTGVVIQGANNILGVVGLGNVISGNTGDGADISGATTSVVANTFQYDGGVGVSVTSAGNTIGGPTVASANLLQVDGTYGVGGGIELSGPSATNNTVQNNILGVNPSNVGGYLGMYGFGIEVAGGATHNTLVANISSGCDAAGILLTGVGTSNNTVQGNFLGVDQASNVDAPDLYGLEIAAGASGNTITGNVSSGNNLGIYIHDPGTSGNNLAGNFVGTDATGTQNPGYNEVGLEIAGGASGNTVLNSVISGNYSQNVLIQDHATTGNRFSGNKIGTDISGTYAINPGGGFGHAVGVAIVGASANLIGLGNGVANVIAGNGVGVSLTGGASGNLVQGNYIGVAADGVTALGNGGAGVFVDASSSNNVLGGTTAAARNVISGNAADGVLIQGGGADTTSAVFISYSGNGTLNDAVTGTPGTAQGTVGYAPGPLPGTQAFSLAGNESGINIGPKVLGTADFSVSLWLKTTVSSNSTLLQLVLGNRISFSHDNFFGIKLDGNGHLGVELDQDTSGTNYTSVSSTTTLNDGAYHNIVVIRQGTTLSLYVDGSLDAQGTGDGVVDLTSTTPFSIGADPNGSSTTWYTQSFVGQIGQVNFFDRVLRAADIAALASPTGIVGGNQVSGNYIGTTAGGTVALANGGSGVNLAGAQGVTVGGTTAGARNVISGNTGDGVLVSGGADTTTGLTDSVTGNGTLNNDADDTLATVQGTVTYAPGPLPGTQAFSFAGDGSGVAIGPRTLGTGDFTISLWLQTSEVSVGSQLQLVLGDRIALAHGNFFDIKIGFNGIQAEVDQDGSGTNYIIVRGQKVVTDGRYHQVTVTRHGATLSVYVDGTLDSQQTGTGVANLAGTVPFAIGGDPYGYPNGYDPTGGTQSFTGQIGQVKFYSRALGAADIAALAGLISDQIVGNFIGTTAGGLVALANGGSGVDLVGAQNVAIGGTAAGAGNVISGNAYDGVAIRNDATGNRVLGNLIGLGSDGATPVPNQIGVEISSGSTNNVVGGTTAGGINVISGNYNLGVAMFDYGTTGNVVQGSRIGTNAAGTMAVGNANGGIYIGGPSGNTVGGTAAGAGNLISGNGGYGVLLTNAASSGNAILGNLIGTDVTGQAALGNAGAGVLIQGAPGNTIGGNAAGAGNTIAGTKLSATVAGGGAGIAILGAGGTGTTILGNTIGGSLALRNLGAGIAADLSAIIVGGTLATSVGNVITFNAGAGIALGVAAAASSRVDRNRIVSNGGLGIDVEPTFGTPGVTPNVPNGAGDAPYLTGASIQGGVLLVSGYARPGSTIEFYVAGSPNAAGFGQGATYLGTGIEGSAADGDATVGTYSNSAAGSDTANRFQFSIPIPANLTAGTLITAVAVAGAGNTPLVSEFALDAVAGSTFGGPIINAGGNATILAGSTFASQGLFTDTRSTSWTARVQYAANLAYVSLPISPATLTNSGDGYTSFGEATFNLSHIYTAPGTYTVTVQVTDDAGLTGTATLFVTVNAVPPVVDNSRVHIAPTGNPSQTASPTIINEGNSVTLTGSFADPTAGTTHAVGIVWGDGSTSNSATPGQVTVDEAHGTFTATHTYTDPGTYDSASGLKNVLVTVASNAVQQPTITTSGLLYVQVNNVAPHALTIQASPSPVTEGGQVTLTGSFQDPGLLSSDPTRTEAHVVTVDWGDGTTETDNILPQLVANGSITFALKHTYLDYDRIAAGYPIKVSVADLFQPLSPATATTTVLVKSAPVSNVKITAPAAITEGQVASLTGTFTAPSAFDRHVVTIDWGDGSAPSIINVAAGATTFSTPAHRFKKTSLGQPGGTFTITASVADPDQGAAPGQVLDAPAVATAAIRVADIAPTVSGLALAVVNADGMTTTPLVGNALQVNGGTTVMLTGSYKAPNSGDAYALLINWGDGTTSTPTINYATHTFTAYHLFVDSDKSTELSTRTIQVTATDSEGTSGSGSQQLTVAHVKPTDTLLSGGLTPDGAPMLTAQVTTANPAGVSYQWYVNGVLTSNTSSGLTIDPTLGSSQSITSTATDDHGDSVSYTAQVELLNGSSDAFVTATTQGTTTAYTVASPATATCDAIIVSAQDASNVIVNAAAVDKPVSLDGNGTNLKLIGGKRGGYIHLHTDGSTAITNSDTVVVATPNCTLTAIAAAGNSTLDFSTAGFGVTFDMTQTGGQVQDVNPNQQPGEHFVAVQDAGGTFSQVVGSSQADTITASSNSTIVGGGGADTFNINSQANVKIIGGAQGATINSKGMIVGNISYQGDRGPATFNNTGVVTGTISYSADTATLTNTGAAGGTLNAGADTATLTNSGSILGGVVFGGVVFNGGADTATLVNSGTIGTALNAGADTATLTGTGTGVVFNGGADTATLVNQFGGTINGGVVFNGGADTATLVNPGTGAPGTTLSAGADTATLVNQAGGTINGGITFNGGADTATLVNQAGGTVNGGITFNGGADTATLVNPGTGSPGTTLNAGADTATLTNSGTVTGGITFNAGADTATLTNDGTVTGGVVFNGGADTATLVNPGTGTPGTTLNAGADTATLTNNGSIDSLIFNAGADTATFSKNATIIGSISYHADTATLVNNATVVGTMTFNGGADTATLVNQGNLANLVFNGGADTATLVNSGTIGTTLNAGADTATLTGAGTGVIFNGGADTATLVNQAGGTINGGITFNGGADTATLVNQAGGTINGGITFNAGADTATLTNTGDAPGTTLNAGADTATLTNNGSISGDVVLNAGADTATLVNPGTGAPGTTLNAGADTATLTNTGTITGNVVFNAGADTATLVNNGTAGGTGATLSGGADTATLTNSGTITGGITFNAGADTATLVNPGTGAPGTTLNAGADTATLTNSGSVGGPIIFNAGADTNTFINRASGQVGGLFKFTGQGGADTVVNLGKLADVAYQAGAGVDTFLNAGVAKAIAFAGTTGVDLLANGAWVDGVYAPGHAQSITYTGGLNVDRLENGGTVCGAIRMQGVTTASTPTTTSSMTLVNNGSAGSIVFVGDARVDQLGNFADNVNSISFTGGTKANLLVNQGNNVGSIIDNAAGTSNIFNNSGAGFGTIVFNGQVAGSLPATDLVINTGAGNAAGTSTIAFHAGADSGSMANNGSGLASIAVDASAPVTLLNTGSNIGQIAFKAATGGGTFQNSGNSVGSICFAGGAQANLFRNDGTNVGTVNYLGGSATNYVLNDGAIGQINVTGGAVGDTLANAGSIGSANGGGAVFAGGGGADTLINYQGAAIFNLAFTGGTGTDQLLNSGTIATGKVNFQGGQNGLFDNTVGGTASGITYLGGAAGDTVLNYGSLSKMVFDAGDGGGQMELAGVVNSTIAFNGGAGINYLRIDPATTTTTTGTGGAATTTTTTVPSTVTQVTLTGTGAGTNVLANHVAGASKIKLDVGATTTVSNNTLWNDADNVVDLTMVGGAGTNVLNNSGGNVGLIAVSGGSGTNNLINSGIDDGSITFIGTSGTDTLINSGASTTLGKTTITFNAGSNSAALTNSGANVAAITLNGSSGRDTLTNSGSGVGTIILNAGTGADALVNSGSGVVSINFLGKSSSATLTDTGSVGTITFVGSAAGNSTLIYSAVGAPGSSVNFTGQGGGNVFVDSGSAGSVTFTTGSGSNKSVIMGSATGAVTLVGGSGNNSYQFFGDPQVQVTVDQPFSSLADPIVPAGAPAPAVAPSGQGLDTLDFSGFAGDGNGINLDLMKTTPQALARGFTLTLSDAEGISGVIGTQYADTVYGNLRPDVLQSAALADDRLPPVATTATPVATTASPAATTGDVGTAAPTDARTQWVYLDFDTYTTDPNDHVYTAAERAGTLARIQADYYGPDPSHPWFDVRITDKLSDIPSQLVGATSNLNQYATLYFNRTPPSGLPGGESSEIDLGNRNFGGYASIQINGILGGADEPPYYSTDSSGNPVDNFVVLSAKIGAHELGHLMGIRHSDAFGPIGFGVHTLPGSDAFNPNFDGADAAFETFDHLISSPATVGSDRFNDLRGLDFGPREAIKLAFASQGTTVDATKIPGGVVPVALAPLSVPNTDIGLPDVEKGMTFNVAAVDVEGKIAINSATGKAAPDDYTFLGRKGDVMTFEVDSEELARLGGKPGIDSVLTVFDPLGRVIAMDDDQYEGSDSLILDLTLPQDGQYTVRVASYSAANDPNYKAPAAGSPLDPNNLDGLVNPLSPNYDAGVAAGYAAAVNGTGIGGFDLFMYRFAMSDPAASDTGNTLVARGAGSTLLGSTGTDTLIAAGSATMADQNNGPSAQLSMAVGVPAPTVDLQAAFTDTVTLGGATGSATVSYDGGKPMALGQFAAGSSIPLSYQFTTVGAHTALVEVQTGAGTFGVSIPVTVTMTQSPSFTLDGPTSGTFTTLTPLPLTGTLLSPYTNASYVATWTFINSTTHQTFSTPPQAIATTATPVASLAFSTSYTIPVAGTYSIKLTVTNSANSSLTASTTLFGTVSALVTINNPTPSVIVQANPTTYNGKSYAGATAQVVGVGNVPITDPAVTYAYYAAGDTMLANPLKYVPIDPGTYQVVAQFAGNGSYTPAQSLPSTFTISPATPKVVATPASTIYTGASYAGASATATVVGVTGPPAFSFTYTYYSANNGVQGQQINYVPTEAGTYFVVASTVASTDYAVGTSAPVAFTIAKATPKVVATPASATYTGASYAGASATATGVNGAPATTFTYTYTYYLASNGAPGQQISSVPTEAGSYFVVAATAAGLDYAVGTSAPVAFTIAKATPALNLVATSTTYNGQADAATASLTGVGNPAVAVPGATLTYSIGSTSLGSSAPTNAGTYQVVANFAGNQDYAPASVTKTFTISPASLSVTAAGASKVYGVDDSTALTGSLVGVVAGDTITPTYTSPGSTASADVGTYTITPTLAFKGTASATNYVITYAAGTLKVSPATTWTAVTSSATSNTSAFGAPVTFTATVQNKSSSPIPTGTVAFYDGATLLGAGTAGAAGTWTFTTSITSPLSVGSHSITAAYTPTADFSASNSQSTPLTQAITKAATTIRASAPAATVNFGQATALSATVAVAAPSTTTIPDGLQVDFFDTTTQVDLGMATLSGGVATLLKPAVPLPVGTQAIVATFAGTGTLLGATAATFSLVVQPSDYILNATAGGAVNIQGSSSLTTPGLLQVNSSSSSAITLSGNTRIKAGTIQVVGGTSVSGSSSFSTTPVKAAAVADPLASLPVPTAAGLTNQGSVNISYTTLTINPGIYSSINVTGSATLYMNPGLYVIVGGGFAVNGAAKVSSTGTGGVTIYNAGSNWNGGTGTPTYGGIALDGSASVKLTAPTTGPYAGISFFQARDNARAVTLTGAAVANLGGGAIYAPAALLNISGSAQVGASGQPTSPLVVGQLLLTGNTSSALSADGRASGDDSAGTAGQLLAGDVAVYVDDEQGEFTADELARIADAVAAADRTVAPDSVHVVEVADPALATTIIRMAPTSASGSAGDGILGSEAPDGITLVSGWDWYTGADPSAVGLDQFDFETIVLHELGHALGLGHSPDANSVMYATLTPGTAKRSLDAADLDIPDADTGPCALHAAWAPPFVGPMPLSAAVAASLAARPTLPAPSARSRAVAEVAATPTPLSWSPTGAERPARRHDHKAAVAHLHAEWAGRLGRVAQKLARVHQAGAAAGDAALRHRPMED